MQRLELKATHKPVQNYYAALRQFDDLGVSHEGAVKSAFHGLLDHCARQHDWTLVPEWEIRRPRQHSARVQKQRKVPIFVVISNPPYNTNQADENDNNKNRKYPVIDARIAATYAADSTLRNKLSDPYIKDIRWASDRIGSDGIVALVTNSGFLEGIACDGMRKGLAEDFDAIYVLDLGGNVRKNPKLASSSVATIGGKSGDCGRNQSEELTHQFIWRIQPSKPIRERIPNKYEVF
jgi:hypothetical protein